MAHEVLLYDLQHSPACAKVRICLQLKGVPYRRVTPGIGDVLRGTGIPRVVLDDGPVDRADAIVRRLEVEWPTPALVPADAGARAYCALLEGWADAALGGAVRRFLWGPDAARTQMARAVAGEVSASVLVPAVAAALAWRAARLACSGPEASDMLREQLGVLEAMLGDRPFLLGRTLTRADVAAFAQLACARRLHDDVSVDEWPAVAAWFARLDEMPAIGTALGT
jgi:glutathione S-transferase